MAGSQRNPKMHYHDINAQCSTICIAFLTSHRPVERFALHNGDFDWHIKKEHDHHHHAIVVYRVWIEFHRQVRSRKEIILNDGNKNEHKLTIVDVLFVCLLKHSILSNLFHNILIQSGWTNADEVYSQRQPRRQSLFCAGRKIPRDITLTCHLTRHWGNLAFNELLSTKLIFIVFCLFSYNAGQMKQFKCD